jgi:hypothetical protein
VDDVRGQTSPFARDARKDGTLTSALTAIDGDLATLEVEGTLRLSQEGSWSVGGFTDANVPTPRTPGAGSTTSEGRRCARRPSDVLDQPIVTWRPCENE